MQDLHGVNIVGDRRHRGPVGLIDLGEHVHAGAEHGGTAAPTGGLQQRDASPQPGELTGLLALGGLRVPSGR